MTPDPPAPAPGTPDAPGSRARLFVAVWPPPDVVDVIAEAVSRLGRDLRPGAGGAASPPAEGLRWTRPEQWHVTLVFLGARNLHATIEAFRQTVLPPGPVTVTLGPETGRFGRRIVHVPAAGLDEVASAVRAVLPGDDDRPFSGHVTLARADARRRQGSRAVDLSSVVGVPLSASFPVTEVDLVLSRLGHGPAAYEVVDGLAL